MVCYEQLLVSDKGQFLLLNFLFLSKLPLEGKSRATLGCLLGCYWRLKGDPCLRSMLMRGLCDKRAFPSFFMVIEQQCQTRWSYSIGCYVTICDLTLLWQRNKTCSTNPQTSRSRLITVKLVDLLLHNMVVPVLAICFLLRSNTL